MTRNNCFSKEFFWLGYAKASRKYEDQIRKLNLFTLILKKGLSETYQVFFLREG